MSASEDAKTYAQALGDYIDFVTIFRQALRDKVDVMTSEGVSTTNILEHLRQMDAAQRSLQARVELLKTELNVQVVTTRPPVLVADIGYDVDQTVTEGEGFQFRFLNSFDPEGTDTFGNGGLSIGYAKVDSAAPDLAVISFGGAIPWIVGAVAPSVSADTSYEYDFWVENSKGQRSTDPANQAGDDEDPRPGQQMRLKITIKNSVIPTPPAGLTSPTTLRKAFGVYIGSGFTPSELRSRIEGYEGAAKLNVTSGQVMEWFHTYNTESNWNAWMATTTALLESFKPLADEGRKLFFTVKPFCAQAMNSSDKGWATLQAAGFSFDPRSLAAAGAGAYNWYYSWLGREIQRIFGPLANQIILSYAHEANGNWYPWTLVDISTDILKRANTRDAAKEANMALARRHFHDQVIAPIQSAGNRVYFAANFTNGTGNQLASAKASIPLTVSAVSGRLPVDIVTCDTYQHWTYSSTSSTAAATAALDAYADWANTNGMKFGITETSTTFTFAQEGGSSTLSGAYSGGATVTLASASSFSSSGFFAIAGKYYKYTGKNATQLTGVTRASAAVTHANGTQVKEMKNKGGGDAGGSTWWNGLGTWAEARRASGQLIVFLAFDADNSNTAQFGILEHKTYDPVLAAWNGTGFAMSGTGLSATTYKAKFGGNRNTAYS